jgi:predicted exporter
MSVPSLYSGKNRLLPLFWIGVHAGLLLALALSVPFAGPVRINTNLFDMLPVSQAAESAGISSAEAILSGRSGRQVNILASSADFEDARRGAAAFYGIFTGGDAGNGNPAVNGDAVFESLSLYVDETVTDQCIAYLHQYRYALLDKADKALLENGGAEALASEALASAFGAFTLSPLDNLETDPFLLAERKMNSFLSSALLSGGSLSLREDVLAARYEGRWYVLIRGALSAAGVSLARGSAVEKIYAACAGIGAAQPGLSFVYSGIPFHSYESSTNARREISLISTLSVLIILVIFLCVFRSALPVLASILAAAVSVLLASASALLVFREIHILSFVFGTTLIGTCVDYSIHYFVHRQARPFTEGGRIRSRILRGIAMSFISTEVCFIALLFAPFGILKQFAVFSLTGLLSSFLTVICIFPLIKEKKRKAGGATGDSTGKIDGTEPASQRGGAVFTSLSVSRAPPAARRLLLSRLPPVVFRFPAVYAKRFLLAAVLAVSASLLIANRDRVRLENDIGSLYTASAALLESEQIAAKVLNHGSSGWYFIVSGSTAEETLEREERLRERLDLEAGRGLLKAYLAASLFVPSLRAQRQSYEAARNLLPLADEQLANLGFPPEASAAFRADFAASEGVYAAPGPGLPPYLGELLSNLWLGKVGAEGKAGGRYYSCVLPLHAADEAPFRAIASELDQVYFVNKVKDIGRELDALTRTMLNIFLAAYIVIALLVKVFYSWKQTLRICAVPFLLVLVTVTVFALADRALGFFSVTGLVLVFGLGLDYMFYITESEKRSGPGEAKGRRLAVLAIYLSFATTALSFGALALSNFIPVHIFGLSVFTGLSTAFISAMFLRGSGSENQRIRGGPHGPLS